MIKRAYRFLVNRVLAYPNKPKRYRYLFQTIKETQPTTLMEIGVWNGERAKEMISCASRYHDVKNIKYFGFDLFELITPDKFKKEISKQPPGYQEVLDKLNLTGANIRLYQGDTAVVLPKFVKESHKIDFIFIDGGHSIETVKNDWSFSKELMHENSVVIFDDYWNRVDSGAKPIVDSIDREIYEVEILPITDRFKKEGDVLEIKFARVRFK